MGKQFADLVGVPELVGGDHAQPARARQHAYEIKRMGPSDGNQPLPGKAARGLDEFMPRLGEQPEAISERRIMTVDLIYGDHEGGQRTITRLALLPHGDDGWLATVHRHWNLDRPDPR